MSTTRFFSLTALLAIAAAAVVVEPVQAQSFTFTQGGYADGALLTGSFAGTDLDGDGWLYGDELTSFELHWSGNRAVQAFNLDFSERAGLEYQLSTGSLTHMAAFSQDGEGVRLFSYDSMGWPTYALPGVVIDEPLGLSSTSWEPLQVTVAVPEPQSVALLLAGLGVVALRSRCQRRH